MCTISYSAPIGPISINPHARINDWFIDLDVVSDSAGKVVTHESLDGGGCLCHGTEMAEAEAGTEAATSKTFKADRILIRGRYYVCVV